MKRKTKIFLLVLSPVVVLIGVLAYYQFFYQSNQVPGSFVQLSRFYEGHRHIVTAVQFSRDSRLVASASVDSTIQIWQTADGALVRKILHPAGITGLDWSADNEL